MSAPALDQKSTAFCPKLMCRGFSGHRAGSGHGLAFMLQELTVNLVVIQTAQGTLRGEFKLRSSLQVG